jgi:hypothetical protein
MLQSSSSKLVQVFGMEIEVQLLLIQQNFDFTIDELKLWICFKLHEITWIYLQSCSMMIPDDELGKEMWFDLKKFEEKMREKFDEKF